MKKVLGLAALLVGLGALAKRLGPRMQDINWGERFEAMPDSSTEVDLSERHRDP